MIERLLANRHPRHTVAGDQEAEVARTVEPVTADFGEDDGFVALVLDASDVERDALADELAVAPRPDLHRSGELSAPAPPDAVTPERREEGLDVVRVRSLQGSSYGLGRRRIHGRHSAAPELRPRRSVVERASGLPDHRIA